MSKVDLDTEKLYYGFPIFLLGYKDENYGYNYSTNSSSYTLGDMIVVGIYKYGNAIQQIKKANCFTINIPTQSLMKEVEMGGVLTGEDKFELASLHYTISKKVDAPIIHNCILNIECEVIKIVEVDEFENYCNIFAKIKGRLIDEELQDNGVVKGRLINPVYFIGDGHKRSYRYLNDKKHDIGDFLNKE